MGEHGGHSWLLLAPEAVPARWRERSKHMVLVPLLAEEAEELLAGRPPVPALDDEEAQLADLVAQGLTASQIATRLTVSPRTVQRRIERLCSKVGAQTKGELTAVLARQGFG